MPSRLQTPTSSHVGDVVDRERDRAGRGPRAASVTSSYHRPSASSLTRPRWARPRRVSGSLNSWTAAEGRRRGAGRGRPALPSAGSRARACPPLCVAFRAQMREVRIHDTLTGAPRPLEPREPRQGRHLRLRADRLRPDPRRQRAPVRGLLAAEALPRARGLRRDARRERHRRERQDLRRRARARGRRARSSRAR